MHQGKRVQLLIIGAEPGDLCEKPEFRGGECGRMPLVYWELLKKFYLSAHVVAHTPL